ncbi:SDR family oxidoreductase [Amycolatopsis ultiminotia]|uniref:SDR family oxidoreductase n=1 Tax=Amycolatopsis ultiminotia TaxID=543629 RepID=A0ABP6XHD2_9PSEU
MTRRTALVTGASRGIGAATAKLLGASGFRVVLNYRDKARRAEQVARTITTAGGAAIAVQADLTGPAAVAAMMATVGEEFGRLDLLVLNASGGMERDADAGYAMRLNRDAQLDVLERALPLMPSGSRVVFVTSHLAHFHDRARHIGPYEPVAVSKRAGEDALRARIPELTSRGIGFVVVSGDIIEGTATVLLLDRASPGLLAERRRQVGTLPTVAGFAEQVAAAGTAELPPGHTVYVGGADYFAGR